MKTNNYLINHKSINTIIDFNAYKNEKNLLIQIFCGENKDVLESIINKLLAELPQSICIGTSTDGEIYNSKITTLKTIVSISVFDDTKLKTFCCDTGNSYNNGKLLAQNLLEDNTKLIITFTDGAYTNGEEFLNGISSVNSDVIICGGMAGDNASFQQTFISSQNKILTKGSVGVSLNSNILKACNAYNFNWSPIGVDHIIESAKGNRVYKISGLSPVDFYEKYLGEYVAKSLPATGIEFPLIVQKNNLNLARAVIAKHEDGSLSFAGNLNEGDTVKLGFGNMELIMSNPLKSLFDDCTVGNSESFFIYACMARRRYMPSLMDMEIKPFSKIAPTTGFFTYGEFFHKNNKNVLLNQTLTVVALSEKKIFNLDMKKNKKQLNNKISDHSRSLQALTHLIQQSSEDYLNQSKELKIKTDHVQSLLTSQKQFLKHAVHETNTPLSIIMGNIEMFEMEYGKNKYFTNIEVAMKSLFNIYDDLSYLIKKDHVNRAAHNINIVDFLRSRVEFFEQSAKHVKKKLNFKSNRKSFIINFDEIKLQRLIDNNITNAIKYTFVGEIININLNFNNDECHIIFESNSTQILDKDKIFEEYYREENSKEGFGLGLNLVKRICTEENIKIVLDSGDNWNSFTYILKGIK